MAKQKTRFTKNEATAHLSGVQRTTGGMEFDPAGARAGQSSAWGVPWWSTKRPSASIRVVDLNAPGVVLPVDPPTVQTMPAFSVDLSPSISD